MPKFRKKEFVVEASRLLAPMEIMTENQRMAGEPGDWLITGDNGEQRIFNDLAFRELFEPVDDEAKAEMEKAP